MSDLIRGGQITLHKYRMLSQVVKLLLRLSIGIIISSVVACYYYNISAKDWQIGFTYLKHELRKTFTLNESNHQRKTSYKQLNKPSKQIEKTLEKFQITFDISLMLAGVMHLLAIGGVIAYFCLKGRSIKANVNLRGVFLIKAKILKKALQQHNKIFKNYQPFELVDFAYPITGRKDSWTAGEQSHTLILGSTGSGKTKIIQQLVFQLQNRNQKAIIIDVKGDYIERFYQEAKGDIILNPLDLRGRNWSFFNETNPLKGFSGIAKSLLPKESKGDPIWIDAARGVFSELANLYVNENLSMAEFADKILKTDLKTLAKLLEKTSASKIINPEIEKAALSVLMVLSTYLRPLKLYQNKENSFSITNWINDKTQNNFLFISSKADVKEDINPLITTMIDIAINGLRSLNEESNIPKIWFILDEIPFFNQAIPSLKDGLATTRSYGGCFVLGSQDMSSLAHIYSENIARSIANNCKTKIYLNIVGKETAEYCSSSLGEGEIEEWHEGLSYGAHEMRDGISINKQRVVRRNVLASEFNALKTGEGFISFAGFAPARFKSADYNFKKINIGYLENLELMTLFKKELEEGEKHRKAIEAKLMKSNFKSLEQEITLNNDAINSAAENQLPEIIIEQQTETIEITDEKQSEILANKPTATMNI